MDLHATIKYFERYQDQLYIDFFIHKDVPIISFEINHGYVQIYYISKYAQEPEEVLSLLEFYYLIQNDKDVILRYIKTKEFKRSLNSFLKARTIDYPMLLNEKNIKNIQKDMLEKLESIVSM